MYIVIFNKCGGAGDKSGGGSVLLLCLYGVSRGGGEEVAQSLGAELSLNVAIPCKVSPCSFIPGTVLIRMLLSVCGWLGFFISVYRYMYHGLSQFSYAISCKL